MRFSPLLLAAILISACSPARPLPEKIVPQMDRAATEIRSPTASVPATPAPLVLSPPTPSAPTHFTSRVISGITFEGVAFDSRTHRLRVVDQSGGPGSRFADAASAARSVGGIAAVNAGFFTPEGAPLGLVVSDGRVSGNWNGASSLGSGVWYEKSSAPAISRREKIGRSGASATRQLIQSGPFLVEDSRPVGGLDSEKISIRMLIIWDGNSRWWIGRTSSCTLAQVAAALENDSPTGWSIRHALNLDGGRSSDLWVSEAVSGGPVSRRPPWNRPVRNFLVLTKQ